jgi:hypothetical protein
VAAESGANVVTPTRAQLSTMTGIRRLPTITAALTALSKGKWAAIEHVPIIENRDIVGSVLKIKLLHRANENRYVGKKAKGIAPNQHRAHKKRSTTGERNSLADSPTERARRVPALSPIGGSGHNAPAKTKATNILDGASKAGEVPQGDISGQCGLLRKITEILGIKSDG